MRCADSSHLFFHNTCTFVIICRSVIWIPLITKNVCSSIKQYYIALPFSWNKTNKIAILFFRFDLCHFDGIDGIFEISHQFVKFSNYIWFNVIRKKFFTCFFKKFHFCWGNRTTRGFELRSGTFKIRSACYVVSSFGG